MQLKIRKVVFTMNKTKGTVKKAISTLVEKFAIRTAEQNANASCVWYNNQPVLPQAVKKLRKF